jgi:death-on-curing protein
MAPKLTDEIPIDEEWLRTLYDVLIELYKNTERPIVSGFPIVLDYDPSMLSACVQRPRTTIGGKALYPHILQRATILMHSIIVFHPFVDGNKRSALLATNFYLHWNGYRFVIPYNADEYTIEIALNQHSLNDILSWIVKNTVRTPITVLNNVLCRSDIKEYPISRIPLKQRVPVLATKTFLLRMMPYISLSIKCVKKD